MATKYYALLTNVGAAKLANATALGEQVEITQMAVGDGNGALPTPNPAQTALVHELRRASLNTLTIDPVNTNQIIAEQVIPEDVGGWWIREIGLYDSKGDLIAIANCAETYKPLLQEGSGRMQVIRVILIVSSTQAVTLKIDPSVVLATRQYVDDQIIQVKAFVDQQLAAHIAAADPHKQYAPKASPALTGTPTAPTATAGNNSTQLANTAFVQAALVAVIGGAPTTLDTLKEIATAINNDPNFSATINNALALKAPLASPAMTGTPTAPTAAQTVNNTQIATTEFVKSAIAALVASSPAALDTLNELAEALGNDPNFATTVTNALAGKQPLDSTLTDLSGKTVNGILQYLGSGDGTLNGRLLNIRVLTSSGNYTPTLGTKKIKVTVIGGGGGSGGVPATTSVQYAASGGGAAGSSVVSLIDVSTLTFPLSYTIGAGGAPGAGAPVTTNGGPGGTTTFGPLTAPGGNGSVYGTLVNQGNTGISGNATPGAIGTGGNILNMRGSAGGYAFLFSANTISGSGGDSLLGKGGFGVGFPPVRSLGTGYGSGGSGVAINLSSAAIDGTAGTAGVIIVEEYA